MANEIEVRNESFLAPVVSVDDALRAYQAKKELIDGIMKPEVDYGIIPGTNKPTLLKAGAEKATSFFGLSPRFTDAEVVNDWTGEHHGGEPFFFYRRTCNLWQGDVLVASVDGSCNSWEKKYRYRWVDESNVPANVDKSKLKTQGGKISEFAFALDRSETTGKYGKPAEYWKRFRDAIDNGTARQIKRKTKQGEADAWEIDGTLYCMPNEDPSDIVNTVLKMADKRALVAATLIATGLSEYFTQDIEDYVAPGQFVDAQVKDVTPPPAEKKSNPAKDPVDQSPEDDRPYVPAVFKARFNTLVNALRGKYKDLKVTDMERKVLASVVDTIFNGDKTMRYEFCKWLTGTSSSKDMSPYHVKGLMTVMEVKSFDDAPNDFSITEIRLCHSEALREMGQEEFPFADPPSK